jgi:hypothetical protein
MYTQIMEATHSIIFFGTPHQGSAHASLGVILQNIHTVLSRQQPSPLPKTLKINNPKLVDLDDDFRHQASKYKIVSCFEQLVTSPLDSLVSGFPNWLRIYKPEPRLTSSFDSSGNAIFQQRYHQPARTILY